MRASSCSYKGCLSRLACFSSALALSGSPALIGAEGTSEGTHKGRTSRLLPSERGTSATHRGSPFYLKLWPDRPPPSLSRRTIFRAPGELVAKLHANLRP